jgi:uncharacterized protein YkwD
VRTPVLVLTAIAVAAGTARAQIRPQLHPQQMPGLHVLEPVESEVEAKIIDRANAFRAEHGRGPLEENALLTLEARDFAVYLARTGAFSHHADGRDPSGRARLAGYDFCEIAENLAWEEDAEGFRDRDMAADLMQSWENSPEHRRNLLDPDVVETGVGVARAPGRRPRYLAVQEFARPSALRFAFQVTNRTGSAVSYVFEGRVRTLKPDTTDTLRPCGPSALEVRAKGSASAPFVVEPDRNYVLQPGAGYGAVRIEITRRGDL